jgi:succinate dehydrogenase / fumarate reductase iron-sulfur subunit
MNFTLRVWRQKDSNSPGAFATYTANNVSPDTSFLEMLDIVNNELEAKGEMPIAVDSDCREGICGTCGVMINGYAHGHGDGGCTCQRYMRHFTDGETITVEPWRAKAFPVLRDLIVNRSAFDRIIQAGGYISMNTGAAPEANSIPITHHDVELAMDAAQCIGCGACVAVCKNASAMLFTSAKISHFALLPQGQPERHQRARAMVNAMDGEGFGNCTNEGECEARCPKKISLANIARMNRDYLAANVVKLARGV